MNMARLVVIGLLAMSLTGPARAQQETFVLEGGGLSSRWERGSGRLVELSCRLPGQTEAFRWFGGDLGPGGFELFDELERVRYSDRETPATVSDLSIDRMGGLTRVRFTKRFQGAPFTMRVELTADAEGLRLAASTVLEQLPDGQWPTRRNVRVSLVLPAAEGLTGWAPAYPDPAPVRERPVRYCYGLQEPGLPRTGIPMYTLYAPGRAGLTLAMPLELPKVQLNLGPEPEDPIGLYVEPVPDPPNAEATLGYRTKPDSLLPEQVRVVRLTELLVGLAADRPLEFAVRLFGHEPHWRPALRKMAEAYPDYFRVHPRMRSLWGSRLGADLHTTEQDLALHRRFEATTSWLHTHFHRHGDFIPDQALTDPDYTWFCEPYAKTFNNISVRSVRQMIDRLIDNGQAVFLYGFNMHADTVSIVQRGLMADVTRNLDGSVTRSYHDQPVMFFHPASPFGAWQLEQMDRMLRLYPRVMGIALDNWAYGGIDFAHDDGITMLGHRPAANINFSQQRMIGAIAAKWHGGGRLVMINKARTIESTRGADSMLSEASGAEIFAMFAYLCLDRHLHANEYEAADDPEYTEHTLQYTLEWGGQLGKGQETADPALTEAYHNLLRTLRNRTWVLEPDPLTLPAGTRGNLWRIHPDDPQAPGDLVVGLVRPDVRLAQRDFRPGLTVRVRLPEAEKVRRASWLAVEESGRPPVPCRYEYRRGELTVTLPKLGAAGVLRLETD